MFFNNSIHESIVIKPFDYKLMGVPDPNSKNNFKDNNDLSVESFIDKCEDLTISNEKSLKKLFISQPMSGLSEKEIKTARDKILKEVEKRLGQSFELIDSIITNAPSDATPLWYLSKSLELLATADIAYFGGKWKNARGCKIEHTCAMEYEIKIIEK